MSLQAEDLDILADCQTQQDAASANTPFIADDSRGRIAIVPPGERWIIHRAEITCTGAAAASVYVWLVPAGASGALSSSTTKWLLYPGTTIPVKTSSVREAPAGGALRVLREGDSIWLMGGGTVLNLYVLGWRQTLVDDRWEVIRA